MTKKRVALMAVVVLIGLFVAWQRGLIGPKEELHVYAASSLTDAFRELEGVFEEMHPRTDVVLTFAGSQVLRLQIEQGADADIFASADPQYVWDLEDEGWVAQSHPFAYNGLALVVPPDNPAGIESFEDLPRAERIVIGAETVPIGRYTREALENASRKYGSDFAMDVMSHVVSEESNVRLVRAKVELGEADAAIVYRTDAEASDRVLTIPVPEDVDVQSQYWIAEIEAFTAGRPSRAADDWIARVMSIEGREALFHSGFAFSE